MPAKPETSAVDVVGLVKRLNDHAKMCADFERYSTGPFRAKYPDYNSSEGVHYITRHAQSLAKYAATIFQGSRP